MRTIAKNRIKVAWTEKQRADKWLVEQLGKASAIVSKWYTNTAQPGLKTFFEIAKVLDCDIKDLLRSSQDGVKYIRLNN